MERLFGTDGIRGVANRGNMTPEMAMALGEAVVCFWKREKKISRPKVLIGKDTRLSGGMLEMALTSGVCSMGGEVFLAGILPTPAISYLTTALKADIGIVISASHNPYTDNGIKIFGSDGEKLEREEEESITKILLQLKEEEEDRPLGPYVGSVKRCKEGAQRYLDFLVHSQKQEVDLKDLRIVIDCAHGAASQVARKLLSRIGADAVVIAASPDGRNINERCGSLFPGKLAKKVISERADFGVALDGDGDRALFIDAAGSLLTGDHILAMMAIDMKERGELAQHTLVATVMSNFGLDLAMQKAGIRIAKVGVGDSEVRREIHRHGFSLGGEQSGHIIFADHSLNGDGLYTLLRVADLINRAEKSLAELAAVVETVPQVIENVPVKERRNLSTISKLSALIENAQKSLGERGRVLVRYSGTEFLARVMIEGEDSHQIRELASEIAGCIRQEVGISPL